jgi:hypothetical protein
MDAIFTNRKGIDFLANWMVIFFFAVLILSFLLSQILINQRVTYIIFIFAGLIIGRLIFTTRYGNRLPYYVISLALLAGFITGYRVGSPIIMIALHIGSIVATYKISKLV